MTQPSLADFADRVSDMMPAIMKEFMRNQAAEFYKLKMTMPQFFVLDILIHAGESKMSDLAKTMSVTTAAMTGVVTRLVRDGYVSREEDPRDRRIVKVALTPKGSKVIRNMIEKRKEITKKMFEAVSPEDRQTYLRILGTIRDHLQQG